MKTTRKQRFTETIEMFFANDKEHYGWRIDDLIVFEIDKQTLQDIINQTPEDKIVMGFSSSEKQPILKVVDLEHVATGAYMVERKKQNGTESMAESLMVDNVVGDLHNLKSNLKSNEWEKDEVN